MGQTLDATTDCPSCAETVVERVPFAETVVERVPFAETAVERVSFAETAVERMPYPVVILDGDLLARGVNAQARALLEQPAAACDAATPFDTILAQSSRIPTDARRRILSCCEAAIRDRNGQGQHDEVLALAPDHAIALHVRPLGADRWMAVLEERRIDASPRAAPRDPLRDIGNRQHIEKHLAEALRQADPDQRPAVLVFDIDRFGIVNDRLGRRGGDALLRAVVGRMRRACRETDHIGRLDGDAFAVLQVNGDAADKLAARLVEQLGKPYVIEGEAAAIGISLGVARAQEAGTTAAALLRHAELARREARDAGGQTWRRYNQNVADRARARLELESDLRKALDLGQLSLAYQPRVNLRTRAVTGFEALARWTHPRRGAVPPALFIPVAEDIGLIGPIGEWALRTACQDALCWPEPLVVSVNISARQLNEGQRFVSRIAGALRDSGLPTRRLELEIAEPALAGQPEEARILLRDLHELGVRLAMDNFGSGPSSIQRLRAYPFDTVKIDRSLIHSLDSNNDSGAVVRAIAALGTGLGLTVIAVGVETLTQARMVEADGCTDIQGFLVGRPIAAAGVDVLLTRDLGTALAS